MRIEPPSSLWAEAVFHVLAQLPIAERVPASLYSPWYATFVASLLGPADARPLGTDLAALGAIARDHHTLRSLQALAWLWRDSEQALACADRELSLLRPDEVAEPALLTLLRQAVVPAELLRCAALLELEAYRRLPPPQLDAAALLAALHSLLPVAGGLATASVTPLRALTRHGRVRGASIWVGVPSAGVSLAHVALQAAHEATVREVARYAARRALPMMERRIERIALVLLATRIERSPGATAHPAWCAEHAVRKSDLLPASLTLEERVILDGCLV